MESEAIAGRKRTRDDSSSSPELESAGGSSPEAKRLHEEHLFDMLDDDTAADDVGAGGELATFMKTFEEEISFSASPPPPPAGQGSPSAAGEGAQSYAPESPPPRHSDLGFLLEASDDELGLPPSTSAPSSSPEGTVAGAGEDEAGFGHIWGVEEDNGFGFDSEFSIRSEFTEGDGGVVFDGELFDYADAVSGQSDQSWRSETLPAV